MRPTLSVVIPVFNEAHRLGTTLAAIRSYAEKQQHAIETIVIDDGSTDCTLEIPEVSGAIAQRFDRNRGKGFAVRQGMLAATGDLILMCDADLSTPLEELDKLTLWIQQGFDIVIGSRDASGSILSPAQPLARRFAAWTFRAIRRRLMLPEIHDTQCGFKLFTREAAQDVFSRATVDGWLFDCEALGIAEKLGYRIREVGVVWRNDPDSRVRMLPTALRTIPELLAIRRRLKRM